MFSWQIFFSTFLVVFFAELGDKTQLVAFSMTSTTKNPLLIFLATSLALSCSSVVAALAGALASKAVPGFVAYISAGLFLVFGAYILLAKEPPKIKELFLKSVSQENIIIHLLPGLAKKDEKNSEWLTGRIEAIIHEEQSHVDLFKLLIKNRKLFKDDINEEDGFDPLMEKLDLKKSLMKASLEEALDSIIKSEETGVAVFKLIAVHLEEKHPEENEFLDLLYSLLRDEEQHIVFFREWKKRTAGINER